MSSWAALFSAVQATFAGRSTVLDASIVFAMLTAAILRPNGLT